MDYVERDQEEHPYVVGLKSSIEKNLSEFVFERALCECVKDHYGRQSY